ncbi:hypothetical protein [Singulisphaera sp. PoT]|uniref:hypothetical protein n=1 Tax=Singulisphaera sp. PoT TaxID=3411797 RepID=UPI003BF4B34F
MAVDDIPVGEELRRSEGRPPGPVAVISCPGCLRQSRTDPSLDGRLGRCSECDAHFAISVPTLLPGGAVHTYDAPLEVRYEFFEGACREQSSRSREVLRLAGRPVTAGDLIGIIRSLPQDRSAIRDASWRAGLLYEAMGPHTTGCARPGDDRRLWAVSAYFCERVPSMSRSALGTLEAAASGLLEGLGEEGD